MALFNKFFTSSSKRKAINPSNPSQNYLSQFPFNTNQVRVLLYRECDNRGRRLLFDSNAIEKIDLKQTAATATTATTNTTTTTTTTTSPTTTKNKTTKNSNQHQKEYQNFGNGFNGFIEISDEYVYKYSRPNTSATSDVTGLGEMIFGALAMSFRGTALKIHWLQSPVRILCSQVFLTPLHSKFYTSNSTKDSTYDGSSGGNINSIYATNSCDRKNSGDSSTSFNSISMPFSICVNKNLNLLSEDTDLTKSLTMPPSSPQTITEMSLESVQSYSIMSTEDSGYNGSAGGGGVGVGVSSSGNDGWNSVTDCQYSQYSTRSSLGSVFSDPESFRKLSIDSAAVITDSSNSSSDMSLKRRISRNISTSFENRNSMSDFIGFISDNYQTTTNGGSEGCVSSRYQRIVNAGGQDSRSNPEMIRNRGSASSGDYLSSIKSRHIMKRPKLGLAICITMSETFEKEMEQFCCEHIALFESMLCRLRASAENAYINHRNFLQIMIRAWQSAAGWLKDIFTAPRVHNPVWLNINDQCDPRKVKSITETFIKELTWLLSFADTKDTNFFVSTMLTALLTYHLGWVSTITAFKSEQYSHVNEMINEQNAKLTEVAQNHPYNALWAQMGDLYGSIGNPPRISRTIIYGTEKNIIEKLLHVLTYFIRCGEVKRSSEKIEIIDDRALKDAIEKRNSLDIRKKITKNKTSSGLTRSPTCFKNLLQTENFHEHEEEEEQENIANGGGEMNECLNVSKQKHSEFKKMINNSSQIGNKLFSECSRIRFTLTTPENVELAVNYLETDKSELAPLSNCNIVEEDNQISGRNILLKKFFSNIKGNITDGISPESTQKNQQVATKETKVEKLKKSSSISNILESHLPHQSSQELNEKKIFDRNLKLTQMDSLSDSISFSSSKNLDGVVFVLGDNEALVNIKRSTEDISIPLSHQQTLSSITTKENEKLNFQQQDNNRKHSSIRFDFENHSQNNIIDKNNLYDNNSSANTFHVMNKCSINELLSANNNFQNATILTADITASRTKLPKFEIENEIEEEFTKRNKLEYFNNLEKTNKIKTQFDFIQLPLPGIEDKLSPSKNVNCGTIEMKSGFIPSLLIGVNDHYIPDMVLQGTVAEPKTWEIKLKQDLTLSSHCATLMPTPVENVAVIADMTKWDVKVISSQNYGLPYNESLGNPIGMSQLVSTMLETVYAMSCSGISANECLSYIESKLHEMYLQSESLAAFLLATEFCSLNTVAAALNLSINDVPLLLSVASVHSPQVTRKYGISFR